MLASLLFYLTFVGFLHIPLSQGQLPVNGTQLASHTFSMEKRYADKWVNSVFKHNILLTMAYMGNRVSSPDMVEEVEQPAAYRLVLQPGETFAFHDAVLPTYAPSVTTTTNAHFNGTEGFKSDGYLMGDGVCHFASLLYWSAKDAGLDAYAPVNHDFAFIPEVPKEYGVSIYNTPADSYTSAVQNLYIRNNKATPVVFTFVYNGKTLSITVYETDKDTVFMEPTVI